MSCYSLPDDAEGFALVQFTGGGFNVWSLNMRERSSKSGVERGRGEEGGEGERVRSMTLFAGCVDMGSVVGEWMKEVLMRTGE